MKSLFRTFYLIAVLLLFNACDKNKNSLGDFRINIATVIPKGNGAYSLELDNGNRLWVAATDVNYRPTARRRVFVNYTILSDNKEGYNHFVKVNNIWSILTKKAIDLNAQNADSIGHDPIKINGAWVGGDYLNVDFMFNYGGIRPHAINLVKNTLSSDTQPNAIDLELRHNAYKSSRGRLYEGFVCFDLKPFQRSDVDSVKFVVKVKDWDGEKKYNLVYRYNQAALRNTSVETPIPVVSSFEYY